LEHHSQQSIPHEQFNKQLLLNELAKKLTDTEIAKLGLAYYIKIKQFDLELNKL
jgi:hypothetical protein